MKGDFYEKNIFSVNIYFVLLSAFINDTLTEAGNVEQI